MKGCRTQIALAAAMLVLGTVRAADADPTTDDRDRAVVAHGRDRSTTRARGSGSAPDVASGGSPAAADSAPPCDRTCLQSLADAYLKAVVAHDPKLLPMDEHARFTENGQELAPGDGFWSTASGVGAASQFYADPQTQQIVYFGTMREFDNLVLMALRLKVQGRRVAEAETLFYRKGAGPAWSDAGIDATNVRGSADSAWLTPIAPAARASREQLTGIALSWLNALGRADGKPLPPLADDCVRVENGTRVSGSTHVQIGDAHFNLAALGCRQQLQSGYFASITRVHHRRVVAIDPDNGTVVIWVNFDQAGARELRLSDGHTLSLQALNQPASTEAVLVFRIEGGLIHRVQMLTLGVPYHMSPGWDEAASP